MTDREEAINDMEILQVFCNAKADTAIGKNGGRGRALQALFTSLSPC